MDALSEPFGELRSLLQRPPSIGVWARLCRVVESWDEGEFIIKALPYVLDHLDQGWPDALRRAPQHWVDAVLCGESRERPWEMVRSIEIRALPLDELVALESTPAEGDEALDLFVRSGALAHARSLFVTDLGITDAGLGSLLRRPEIEGVRALSLQGNHLGASGVFALAHSTHVSELERLDLRSNHWGGYEEAIIQLARSRHLRALRSLDLECDMTSQDLDALLTTSHLLNLEHLGLEGCFHQVALENDEFRELDAAMLDRSISLSRLTSLSLANNMFTDDEIADVLRAPYLDRIDHLDMSWNDIGDDGAQRLATSEALRHLKSLSLRGGFIGEKGALALLRGTLGSLRVLDVSSMRGSILHEGRQIVTSLLGPQTPQPYWIDALCDRRTPTPHLHSVNLSDINLELDGSKVERLAAAPTLSSLKHMELANAGVTEEGVASLLTRGGFEHMVHLNFNRNHRLGPVIAQSLEHMDLRSLKRLKIRECGLRDEDAFRIASSPSLSSLEMLDVRKNDLSTDALDALSSSPHLRVCHLIL